MHFFLLVHYILSVKQSVVVNFDRCEASVRTGAWRCNAVFKEHVEDKLLVSFLRLHVRDSEQCFFILFSSVMLRNAA